LACAYTEVMNKLALAVLLTASAAQAEIPSLNSVTAQLRRDNPNSRMLTSVSQPRKRAARHGVNLGQNPGFKLRISPPAVPIPPNPRRGTSPYYRYQTVPGGVRDVYRGRGYTIDLRTGRVQTDAQARYRGRSGRVQLIRPLPGHGR